MPDQKDQSKSLIVQKDDQHDNVILDLDSNRVIVNKQFTESLAKAPEIVNKAEQLVNTNVDDLTEDDMTELRKNFKPIVKYQRQYADFEKTMKQMLKQRDNDMLDQFHQRLTAAGFDKIPQLTKQYRVIARDFKANRANKRWEEIHELFDASMTTYPEFQKFAPNTLGSFNFYRLHHPDLISEAKTKPVTKATKAQFNQDMYQYHQDLTRLMESTINPTYYPRLIEQYADAPTSDNMISLIDDTMKKQIADEQAKLLAQVTPTAAKLLSTLWYGNDKINNILDRTAAKKNRNEAEFSSMKLRLMQEEGDAILASLKADQFIHNNQVDHDALANSIKNLLQSALKRIYQKLDEIKPIESTKTAQSNQANPQGAQPQTASTAQNPLQAAQSAQSATPKPQIKPVSNEPYSWLLDLLQNRKQANIHNNNKIKVEVLGDLFANLTTRGSVWREHVKSYDDIMNLVEYITQL